MLRHEYDDLLMKWRALRCFAQAMVCGSVALALVYFADVPHAHLIQFIAAVVGALGVAELAIAYYRFIMRPIRDARLRRAVCTAYLQIAVAVFIAVVVVPDGLRLHDRLVWVLGMLSTVVLLYSVVRSLHFATTERARLMEDPLANFRASNITP